MEAPEMMTVQEVACYLRLKERKIYDLLAHKSIPCTRVTGKWLFPKEQIDLWLRQHSEFTLEPTKSAQPVPQVALGSHDPLLEWSIGEIGFPFALQMNGSAEGLVRFAKREGVLCGMHLLDPDSGEYNVEAVRRSLKHEEVVLVHWAWRQQGLILAAGNPLGIQDLADLARTRARVCERQEGAGSRLLFRHLLRQRGLSVETLNLLPAPARSHVDAGLAVCSGAADAGIAVASIARQMRLDFLSLARERFDLVIRRFDYFEPGFQELLSFTRSPGFREKAVALGGYDVEVCGTVLYNKPLRAKASVDGKQGDRKWTRTRGSNAQARSRKRQPCAREHGMRTGSVLRCRGRGRKAFPLPQRMTLPLGFPHTRGTTRITYH